MFETAQRPGLAARLVGICREIHASHWLTGASALAFLSWHFSRPTSRFAMWLGAATLVAALALVLSRRGGVSLAAPMKDAVPAGMSVVLASVVVWVAMDASFLDWPRLVIMIAAGALALGGLLFAVERATANDRLASAGSSLYFGAWAAIGLVPFANSAFDRTVLRSYATPLQTCEARDQTPRRRSDPVHISYRLHVAEHPRGGPGWIEGDEYLCGLAGRGLSVRITVRPGILGVSWFESGELDAVGVSRPR